MKNIWKKLLVLAISVAMMSMLVACPDNGGSTTETVDETIYISGYLGNNWAEASDKGTADAMKKNAEGNWVFSFDTTTDAASATVLNRFPYGFKFSTYKGWNEQYAQASFATATAKTYLSNGVSSVAAKTSRAVLEARDAEGNTILDDNFSKFWFNNELKISQTYTITFNPTTLAVTVAGDFGTELPKFTMSDISHVKGSINSWGSTALTNNVFEFTYDAATMTEIRFIYTFDGSGNYKVQGSECKALGTDVKILDDSGEDAYCQFDKALFVDGSTYVVTLTKTSATVSTCKVELKP